MPSSPKTCPVYKNLVSAVPSVDCHCRTGKPTSSGPQGMQTRPAFPPECIVSGPYLLSVCVCVFLCWQAGRRSCCVCASTCPTSCATSTASRTRSRPTLSSSCRPPWLTPQQFGMGESKVLTENAYSAWQFTNNTADNSQSIFV